MNKICTSQEQSQKLIELGININTADMYYDVNSYGIQSKPEVAVGKVWSKDIPAWSLTALLGLMPDKISINNESYYLSFTKRSVEFRGPITWDGQKAKSFEMDNIIDAAFKMVCWLKENKKL